jgi:7-keto-8-aminopelargonate synthetase-like enzyme
MGFIKRYPARPAGDLTGCKHCGEAVQASVQQTDFCVPCVIEGSRQQCGSSDYNELLEYERAAVLFIFG